MRQASTAHTAIAIAIVCAPLSLNAQSTFVGVLDRPACHADAARAIRVLFVKDSASWRALGPRDMNTGSIPTQWTIAFDGRDRGVVKTGTRTVVQRDVQMFRRDYMLALVEKQSLFTAPPTQSSPSPFDGWCEHDATRPLVVVSTAHATDPDHWHRVPSNATDKSRVFALLKPRADSARYCPKGGDASAPFRVHADDIEIVSTYTDAHERRLVGVRIKPQLRKCDGPPEDAWQLHWFAVETETRFIGRGMSLIDAGDYDGDGVSELLFWYSGYNNDGYVLFTGDLHHRVDYVWSYH